MTSIYANVLEQKKVFTEEKSQLPEICLEHQRGRRFIVLKRQYGRRDVMSKCSISWTFIQSFRIQLQNNLPTFDELNEMEYISAIKLEAARIHFFSDVFVAVAVVVA